MFSWGLIEMFQHFGFEDNKGAHGNPLVTTVLQHEVLLCAVSLCYCLLEGFTS